MGREFIFPIAISAAKHLELILSPESVQSYARTQAELLSASRDIARVLLEEHRAYHRELVNSRRPDPRIWKVGDIVFFHRSTKYITRTGTVGKLIFPVTGPWKVIADLTGESYRIQRCFDLARVDKKHASHFSVYPLEVANFESVDGPHN